MTKQQKSFKTLHIFLWVAQIVLAINLAWASWVKLFTPIEDLARMWPWTGDVSQAFVKFTGAVDMLGAIGLILPSLLRIKPILTPIAAIAIIALMICAGAFHISRGEGATIGVNIVFAFIAGFIAWGRLKRAPITARA